MATHFDIETGYVANVFADKQDQMTKVSDFLTKSGFLPAELVENEVAWFYNNLNIDDYYFALESVETIANHIMSLYGAKILAYTKSEKALDIDLQKEGEESAVYIHSSEPGVSIVGGRKYEQQIDEKFLDNSTADNAYRVESYRSSAKGDVTSQLRSYFITKCEFVNPKPTDAQKTDIKEVADKMFLKKATPATIELYAEVMKQVLDRNGPVIKVGETKGTRERRLVIGYRQGSTKGFYSSISDLYHYYGLYTTRKFVEQFSNGVTIISLYLHPLPDKALPIESSIQQVVKETSLLYCLPNTPLQDFFQSGKLSVQEVAYGYVVFIFAQHFLNRLGKEYMSLNELLDATNPVHEEVLTKMKKRLRSETFTRQYILDIIRRYPELVKVLYANFANVHYVSSQADVQPSISYQRVANTGVLTNEEILKKIQHDTANAHEKLVFESILTFNKHVLKTNFYQTSKIALSFRLCPKFLPKIEYPSPLYGMFLVVGSEFRGFHLRFRDVARGGIRIIRSRNREAYSINLRSLFDENYNLANTQLRKNKDIPEGGSKGTILLDIGEQDKQFVAFEKYIDSILDLLIVNPDEKIVDLFGKPEILFCGPDENTAEYMDWASLHARKRGYKFWKAFTTGKSQSMGGIPHDLYGMTTRSVHQYVLGIYRTFGLKETEVTKLQTGGPDGDLGSNEILISSDKTIGVVDGSGVVYDPVGLDREELTRLAKARKMINHFNVKKLSPQGFRILVDETNVTLPDGTVVDSGLQFRNTFHTNPLARATIFVPCGGRPESVGLDNVHMLLPKEDQPPLFKYIVEGANLFITQEARLRLEKAGIVIFKDASANKGGVTSSSLEVLAALSFNDEEFAKNMSVKDGVVPAFYEKYVVEVQKFIERNAEVEFEALWREHVKSGKPISILSDELSNAIVNLQDSLQASNLFDNVAIRDSVLKRAFPKLLLDTLGLETLLERVPDNYVRAIFSAYLASQFIYKYGAHPDNISFFDFMRENF